MATITAKAVAELRAKTGIGMMECKKALVEADGDMDAAVKILREKGELKAESKMATRIAADGIVEVLKEGNKTAIIEVNTETDFVAKNDTFKAFVKNLLKCIIDTNPADVEALLASDCEGTTVDAKLKELIFQIGEKITIRRFNVVEGVTSTYIHGMGSIGVIVNFNTDCADKEGFAEFAKNIALQLAAGNPPEYVNIEDVPAAAVEAEKAVLIAQAKNDPKNANKPDAIIEKMAIGKLGKFYEENCLVDKEYIKDDNMKVSQYIAATAKALGADIKVASFERFEKGEGIEKREDNLGDEVAKMLGK